MMIIIRVMKIKLYWNHKTAIKQCPVNNCNINFSKGITFIFIIEKDKILFNDHIIIGQKKYGIMIYLILLDYQYDKKEYIYLLN